MHGTLPGTLYSGPEPGSVEWSELVRAHAKACERAHRLRLLEARLPEQIHNAELRAHDLAGRLGLPSAQALTPPQIAKPLPGVQLPTASKRAAPTAPGRSRGLVWDALAQPRTIAELRQATGLLQGQVNGALLTLRATGHVVKDEGRGTPYRRAPGADTPPDLSPAPTLEPPTERPDP